MTDSFDVDEIIQTLEGGNSIAETDIVLLLHKLRELLYLEPNVLELTSPITVCGDTHGQLYDVFELFACAGSKDSDTFLFLGDYVDRGHYSLETFIYLFAHKLKRPRQFFFLRGNHECRTVSQMYGFHAECLLRHGHTGVWMLCNEVFDLLPMAALIDGHVFAVHGGLSPDVPLVERIAMLNRAVELPSSGALCDLCWSDPDRQAEDWAPNPRGLGFLFGAGPADEFCRLNRVDFIVRSHQLAMDGFEWCFGKRVLTVWSAPNYMYRSGNDASVFKYRAETGVESQLIIFHAREEAKRKRPDGVYTDAYFT
jgi:diadenosine tetraphosphatase ApaH/serine/threonine PP2A family protein phosphatase